MFVLITKIKQNIKLLVYFFSTWKSMKCMENPPRLGARGFKGRYTDRGLEKSTKFSCKTVWLVTHHISHRNRHLLPPLRPSVTWSSFLRRCCSTPSMPRSPCSQCTALGSVAGPRTVQQGSAHLPGTAGRPLSVTTHLHDTSSSHCWAVNPCDRTWPWICTTGTSYSREERTTSSFLWLLKGHSRNATFSTLVITTQE